MRKRILVVDDDSMIREFLFNALSSFGYEVTTASDGSEAMDILRENTYHLVITDYNMPHLNGDALTEWIRLKDSLLPVIIISGYEIEESNLKFQLTAFLKKPFNLSKLHSTIKELFQQKRALE